MPGLASVEGDRDVGVHAQVSRLARGGVHPGGDVAGDHGSVRGVEHLYRSGGRIPRLAVEAGTEDRVDDRPRPRQRGGQVVGADLSKASPETPQVGARISRQLTRGPQQQRLGLVPAVSQQTHRNQTVSSVVALAAEDPDRAGTSDQLSLAREGVARSLHQIKGRHAALLDRPAIDPAHCLSVEKGLGPASGSHLGRSVPTALRGRRSPSSGRVWTRRDHGRRHLARVGQRNRQIDALRLRPAACLSVQTQDGWLGADDLDVAGRTPPTQCLDRRLLRREPSCEVARRPRPPGGIFELAGAEQPISQAGPTLDRLLNPPDLDHVDPNYGVITADVVSPSGSRSPRTMLPVLLSPSTALPAMK